MSGRLLDGTKLRAHRERSGQTVEEFAAKMHRTAATVEEMESGVTQIGRADLALIAAALHVHPSDIAAPPPPLTITGDDIRSTLNGPADGSLAARIFGPR